MAGITFPRDQVFRDWKAEESSRVAGEKFYLQEEQSRVQDLRKRIARYHTSETQEPYFYSIRIINQTDIDRKNREIQKTQLFALIILASIAVSLVVYWATSSYFESAWKACQAIADKKEYAIAGVEVLGKKIPNIESFYQLGIKLSRPFSFSRYATVDEIWNQHPTAGAPWLLFFRNIFCWSFPFCGFFGLLASDKEEKANEPELYNLMIDRSKDGRVCPPNFEIQKECDPLTQEPISIQKLHSPQMIYLPNYVTEAKSFVLALLLAGKKDFTDPVYRREFTAVERKHILSQIARIFMISKATFNECFTHENDIERPLDRDDFYRYMVDQRVFDPRGQFTQEAEHSLQEILGNDETEDLNAGIDEFADQLFNVEQRERLRRILKMNFLVSSGYINKLKKDDIASRRILFFEREAGVSLRAPSSQ